MRVINCYSCYGLFKKDVCKEVELDIPYNPDNLLMGPGVKTLMNLLKGIAKDDILDRIKSEDEPPEDHILVYVCLTCFKNLEEGKCSLPEISFPSSRGEIE